MALAVAEDGSFEVAGGSGYKHQEAMRDARRFLQDGHETIGSIACYWIEAEVELPEPPPTVRGEVGR